MESATSDRWVQKGIAVFTLLQSVIWFVLTVIVQFGIYMPMTKQEVKCGNFRDESINIIIYPEIFYGFLWIYTILYFFWSFSSVFVLNVGKDDKSEKKKVLRHWSILTFFVSFVDICSSIYFGVVYDHCLQTTHRLSEKCHDPTLREICFHEVLPMFLITGKCFVFWFANVAFIAVMLKMAAKLNKETPPPSHQNSARVTVEVPQLVYRPEEDLPPSYEVAVAMSRENLSNESAKNG